MTVHRYFANEVSQRREVVSAWGFITTRGNIRFVNISMVKSVMNDSETR